MTVLTVGAIGSGWLGRVTGLMASRSIAYLDNSCFYGQTQSSAEAVQMAANGIGAIELPYVLAPLLSGQLSLNNEPVFDLPHDRIFVEVSSRKVYTLDGVHVSPPLLRRFFEGRPRLTDAVLRYWNGDDPGEARFRAIADDPEMLGATDDEIWVLRNLEMTIRDDDQMTLDFRRLHAMLGDRMVIVAPSRIQDLLNPADNKLLPVLKRISQQLTVPFVDFGPTLAAAWEHYGTDGDPADTDFQRYAEAVFAAELGAVFLDPLKRMMASEIEAEIARDNVASQRAMSFRFRRRKSDLPPQGQPALPAQPMLVKERFEAGNAAWVADWRKSLDSAKLALAGGCDQTETARLAFRAAWYLHDLSESLSCFQLQLARGVTPGELMEGIELAVQAGRHDDALLWAEAVIRADPEMAESAFRLIVHHGRKSDGIRLLEVAAEAGCFVADFVEHLHRDSSAKRQIVADLLDRWNGERLPPTAESLLLLALRFYDPGADVARARDIRHWCLNLESAELALQYADRALTRALELTLRDLDPQDSPLAAERIAAELATRDPMNSRAITTLALLRDADGDAGAAAEMLDTLACQHPRSAAIQGQCVTQWLKADNLIHASVSLLRAEETHAGNASLARLRKRLTKRLHQRLRNTSGAEAANLADALNRLTRHTHKLAG
jgi:hypothetical protein